MPASFTPTQLPPPRGSTGKAARRPPRSCTCGGSAAGRERRSSRLHITRMPVSCGTTVTVHIGTVHAGCGVDGA